MIVRVIAVSICLCCLGWAFVPQASAGSTSGNARALLQERGLIPQQEKWMLPQEIDLRRQVKKLPELQASLIEARVGARRLGQSLTAANNQVGLRLEQARNNIQILKAGRAGLRSEGRQRLVDARIKSEQEKLESLAAVWIEPEYIAGLPAMKEAMIHLTNARNELTAKILWIHDTRHILRQEYGKLADDKQVQTALRDAGADQQLGSGDDYDGKGFLRMLAGYEKHVFNDELPLYRDGDDLRVAAFIGRTPVTFTWHESEEPVMLTASVIEAAGLDVRDAAVEREWRFPDGKKLTLREFKIPYVRFGRHELTEVRAFALPPEGEQYGNHIGPTAFDGQSPVAEPKNLRLVIK